MKWLHGLTLLLWLQLLAVALAASSSSSSASSGSSGSASAASSSSTTENTLTTSCNGLCDEDSPCVIVGQSSVNPINCVNETRCVTLQSGKTALCMEAFDSTDSTWTFAPASTFDDQGVAPFERVGLVQLGDQVTDVAFQKAETELEPLSSLDLAPLNIQPSTTLDSVVFKDLTLSGLDDALPLSSVVAVSIINCNLDSIPVQLLSGSKMKTLDLSDNAITSTAVFQNQSFSILASLNLTANALTSFNASASNLPKLVTLDLTDNDLEAIPSIVFSLASLQDLALDGNPINTSATLTEDEFVVLAGLRSLSLSSSLTSSAMTNASCDSDAVARTISGSITLCVLNDTETITVPPTTNTSASSSSGSVSGASSKSDSHKLPTYALVLIIVAGVLVLVGVAALLYRYWRAAESDAEGYQKLATPSIAIGMREMPQHPYMELNLPSTSSHTTSDFELLHTVAEGYIGLTRLSYDDVFLHKLLRVSSRSELWLGEYQDAPVTIKKIKSNAASKTVQRDFVTEIELMVGLQHARIAAFKGAMWDAEGSELCAVVEYVERGALRHCVTNSSNEIALPISKQHAIARQIADALVYLHAQQIVHGRLNAFNVLLDKSYSAKLSLFAIFHYVKLSPLDTECSVFVAPEVLRGEQPTDKSDVYSFGVVLVELETSESPVRNAQRQQDPRDSITGFHLSLQCSPIIQEIISACLESDPQRRPSMEQIASALTTGAMSL